MPSRLSWSERQSSVSRSSLSLSLALFVPPSLHVFVACVREMATYMSINVIDI